MSLAAPPTPPPTLLPREAPESQKRNRTRINENVWLEEVDDVCVVWVHMAPWHRFGSSSKLDRRVVAANLVLVGLAKTVEVVRGLGVSRATLHRDRQRLLEGGLPAIAALKQGPKGPTKATPDAKARAKQYHRQGHALREITRRLGVSDRTVRRMLEGEPKPIQQSLLSTMELVVGGRAGASSAVGEGEAETGTVDEGPSSTEELAPVERAETDPLAEDGARAAVRSESGEASENNAHTEADVSGFVPDFPHPQKTTERDLDRANERVLARFGVISEAQVRFVTGHDLRFVGALLILPALAATGFFQGVEEVYGKLKNGFYGLRHTVMTVALMLVLRLKRAEHLTGVSPTALGRLLGLDRAPEVKTLRRRLRELARQKKAAEFMRWFARHLAAADPDAVGFLFVDGHTRVYHGKRRVSKAYSTRKRLALPAATDFWVHDVNGEPIFVVTGEVSQSLTKQLLPILKELEREKVIPEGTRVTVVFDRGGWSPKLFKEIVGAGHDFLTYRKGKYPCYRVKDFVECTLEIDGQEVSYDLREGIVRLGVGVEFRQVVLRDKKGHQIAVVTSRKDLAAVEVVFRLGERWRQENFFKYAREEFALDALDSYEVKPEDPNRSVLNPKRKKLDKKLSKLRKEAKKLEADLGRAADANEESRRRTVRGFKIAHGKLRQKIASAREKIEALIARRKKLPKRLPIAEAYADQAVLLDVEHKHFMNAVKMAVYRAETSLLRALGPHYRRSEDEGRALLREAFRSSGSLEVADGELRVTLDSMSAPRRTRAIAALCDQLNEARVRVPGTTLRLTFAVSPSARVSQSTTAPCQEV